MLNAFSVRHTFWKEKPVLQGCTLLARLLRWQTSTFCITHVCRNMRPSSNLQPFPIKLDCTAIHKLPYLHLAMSFIHINNGQTETELDSLICFSSYQHMATPTTNMATVVSALIRKLHNMTSTFRWWGLPTLDHIQNAGASAPTAKSKWDTRGFQQR